MAMNEETLKNLLLDAFPDAHITLTDLSGDDDHWQAEIISKSFRDKSRIVQHQMVYAALGEHMGGKLHALALKTRPPE